MDRPGFGGSEDKSASPSCDWPGSQLEQSRQLDGLTIRKGTEL